MSASRSRTSVGSATLTIVLSMTIDEQADAQHDEREPTAPDGRLRCHGVHDALRSARGRAASGSTAVSDGDRERTARAEHRVLALDVDADRGRDRPAERPQRRRAGGQAKARRADAAAQHHRLRRADGRGRRSRPGSRGRRGSCRSRPPPHPTPSPTREADARWRRSTGGRRARSGPAPACTAPRTDPVIGATDERGGEPVDRPDDQLGREPRRAGSRRRWAASEAARFQASASSTCVLGCSCAAPGIGLGTPGDDGSARSADTGTSTGVGALRRSCTRITTPNAISHTLHSTYPKKFAVSTPGRSSGENTPTNTSDRGRRCRAPGTNARRSGARARRRRARSTSR